MLRREIKPRQIIMRGQKTWVVRVPVDLRGDGPVTRFFGDDKKAAEGYAKQLREARVTVGGEFLRLTPVEQGAVIQCLRELGVSRLLEAVDQYRSRSKASDIALGLLRDGCIEAKVKAGIRANSLKTTTCTLNNFCASFHGKKANAVTQGDVETWLHGNGWSPKTKLNYLKEVEAMFKYGGKFGLSNPCKEVIRPKVNRNAKPFFKPDQAALLLRTCATHAFKLGHGKKAVVRPDIELLGHIAPILFNGLRPLEAARIKPENVRWNNGSAVIDLSCGSQTKLRLRRLVNLNDTCLYWLTLPAPGELGPTNIHIATRNLKKRMDRLIAAAGLDWGHDILRHSFCSYGMQQFGAKETARLSNHSEDVLFNDYREVVSDAEAKAFWNLRFYVASPTERSK